MEENTEIVEEEIVEVAGTDVTLQRDRIMSIIRLVLPLLIGALTAIGIDVDANELLVVIGTVVTAALSVWAWWKNNPVTKDGNKVQNIFRALKKSEDVLKEEESE